MGASLFSPYAQLAQQHLTNIEVVRATMPCVPGISLDYLRIVSAQRIATPLYVARVTKGDESRALGMFVYVDGAFRWIGNLTLAKPLDQPRASSYAVARVKPSGPALHTVPPVYPPEARKKRFQGTVALTAIISREGLIRDVHYVSGPCILAEAAMVAVQQWRYKPTRLNGELMEVQTTIEVSFTLSN